VLDQIDLAIYLFSGPSSVDVALTSDSGGAPGAPLMSWVLSPLPGQPVSSIDNPSCCVVSTLTPATSLTPGASITLDAGTPYWLQVSQGSETTVFVWLGNKIGETGPVWLQAPGMGTSSGIYPQGAFDVLGENPIPEPASGLLVASAAVLLAVSLRRRRAKTGD
jgi:hypothetical protein